MRREGTDVSLKQDIIIVNEYTVPLPGGKGSRGGTPGEYITRYMARDLATETVAPIRRGRQDDFIQRYMARESATEAVEVRDRGTLKRRMGKAQGLGGVAFGYGSVSLSDEALKAASADVQGFFDAGHTVMKTVLSFDQEYLRKHGLIPEDFVSTRKGDYRGHVDQMKLRMAIMSGLGRMGRAMYDELRYVGVIQVDTEHVHCHLSMVDAGRGRLADDGTQKGKINDRAKSFLRRGIDGWLDEKQTVRHLSSAVGYERRNVTSFVKRWAHKQMLRESLPQFLMACLPEDRRLWRLDTNRAEMRKPNRLVKEMVEEILQSSDSPMPDAMAKVMDYATQRRENEGLSVEQWQKLVDRGREMVVERGVNGVYAALRQLPDDALQVRTPMLDAMGMDYEEMAARAQLSAPGEEDDLVGFGFRLRSYSSRMEHHASKREEYHEKARQWEAADAAGAAVVASRALYEFYLEEEEYHAKVSAKYRHFLPFAPDTAPWYDRWKEVAEYGERLLSLESMTKDASLKRMKDADEAERIGRDVYGQAGGALVSLGDADSKKRLSARAGRMRTSYRSRIEDLRAELAGQGLILSLDQGEDETQLPEAVIEQGAEHPFEQVKALDLHQMRYDFSTDVEVGPRARRAFLDASAKRSQALDEALLYLETSDQAESAQDLPIAEIDAMETMAASVTDAHPYLISEVSKLARQRQALRRSRTVRLGEDVAERVQARVVAETEDVAQHVPETMEGLG